MLLTNFYFMYDGNAEEALRFYQGVLGGKFPVIMRMKDVPEMPGLGKLSDHDQQKIMHMSLLLPNDSMIMASDVLDKTSCDFVPGTNFSISISTDSKEEADRIYQGLNEGGSKISGMKMEMWGAYFGTFTDRFGIQWMVSFDKNPGQGELFDRLESSHNN